MKSDDKVTLNVNEDELLKIADKIHKNESEDRTFKIQLDKYFNREMQSHEVINVCSTPNILKILGSEARKVVINQKELENSISSSKVRNKNHTNGHEIEKNKLYKLSEAIRNPILVLKGNKRNETSVILLTELKNNKGENVFVPISLNRQNGKINRITTLYGKKNLNTYLQNNVSKILAINTKKADLFADTENQFLQSINETVVRFDNSIAYSTANVKSFPQKISEISVGLPEFRKENGKWQAKAVYNGKKEWTSIINSDDKLCIRLDDGKRYFFNEKQAKKFKEFFLSESKKANKDVDAQRLLGESFSFFKGLGKK